MFEGMVVKGGKYQECGAAFGVLKPENAEKFRAWEAPKDKLPLEEWMSRAADDLVKAVGTESVAISVWTKSFVATVVRGEFFKEADVKAEFFTAISRLG